ncbi:hypothetical protein TBLA_0I01120 [Henningerozyma blattae CBS 6284]|uniref:Uncharacterized protein n=1 Tax=Henningerozyma blattae (strain ATCC 34711 / CBS 6284 / DSM 70876 / NBRC 10599 / NRRL Y-10934 / UCD 77-7) TaxID=1071380 RepID=I2H8R9_HENB6|nr:hypothetical protein TBLA_0I01120 [Tetrapisispora blattae CBS 6284]CCH62771.1 hypothetical protein TBLA_0I01120 [Tetrapisispora blattae CBS 6284]
MFHSDIFERDVQDPCSYACDSADAPVHLQPYDPQPYESQPYPYPYPGVNPNVNPGVNPNLNSLSLSQSHPSLSPQPHSPAPRRCRTNSSTLILRLSRQSSRAELGASDLPALLASPGFTSPAAPTPPPSAFRDPALRDPACPDVPEHGLARSLSLSTTPLFTTSSNTCSAIPTHLYGLEKYVDSHLVDAFQGSPQSDDAESFASDDDDSDDDQLTIGHVARDTLTKRCSVPVSPISPASPKNSARHFISKKFWLNSLNFNHHHGSGSGSGSVSTSASASASAATNADPSASPSAHAFSIDSKKNIPKKPLTPKRNSVIKLSLSKSFA